MPVIHDEIGVNDGLPFSNPLFNLRFNSRL
jgi:hypothetical protein